MMTRCLRVCTFLAVFGATVVPTLAQAWFPPSTAWLAQRLRDAGCQVVRHDGKAVGGLLKGRDPGPTVVFSSNEPEAAIGVLKALGRPERGRVLAVFGSGVELKSGDYLLKLDYTKDLLDGQIALPESGPSVDTFELHIDASGSDVPDMVVASDLVLTLQNRASTADELVLVQLEEYRDLPGEELTLLLSLRVFYPSLRERAGKALEDLSRQRLAEQGAVLRELVRQPSPQSGRWARLRQALGDQVEVLQEQAPRTELSVEDFGRPQVPSLTVRVGGSGQNTTQALAAALRLALDFEP